MVIKAQSPAGFAEQYIVESIWNGNFPAGSILPAERELSELIGVTRTTLREVLQRLARDGWLTIRHGKPTIVNDFWQTSSVNILETLAELDSEASPKLIEDLFSIKSDLSQIYITDAIKKHPEKVAELLKGHQELDDNETTYTSFDQELHHNLILLADNAIYRLVLNGLKGLNNRISRLYFAKEQGREITKTFYQNLYQIALAKQADNCQVSIFRYLTESKRLLIELKTDILQEFSRA